MVIHNEEKMVERALRSFCDIVDEIIIIHDGKCEDRSLEIAKKYTDKIFERPHIGQAEEHRVFSYAQAKNDWVLQLDADEYLSDELRKNIKRLIFGGADVFDVSWSTYYKKKHYFWFYKRILFRKKKVYFIGLSHEGVKPVFEKARIEKILFPLLHEPPYDNATFAVFRTKWKKWAELQAKQLLQNFQDIPKWNCRLQDWEFHRRIRMNHPIFFGMIATPFFHSASALKKF